MIKYYQWQGHPDNLNDKGKYYFVIKPTRQVKSPYGPKKEFQYLGWFYNEKHNELHFDTRLNHSARPDLLQDVDVKLSNDKLQQMIVDIFSYDPEDV